MDAVTASGNRTVLVTGSTTNLGWEIARSFLDSDDRVILHDRDSDALDRAWATTTAQYPSAQFHTIKFDLASSDEITAAFATLESEGWSPDVLVNSAAHLGVGDTPSGQRTLIREVFEVNLLGLHACSLLAAQGMAARDGGTIVNVSSLAGEQSIPHRASYTASKGAVDALTRAMAVEWIGQGVRINAVAPGYIETDRWTGVPDAVAYRRRSNIPMGRPSSGREVAQVVHFLAGDSSSSIVGDVIRVDGGMGAQQLPADVTV